MAAGLLLALLMAPAVWGGQGLESHTGQLTIRLLIPEPPALNRDQPHRPCLRQRPAALRPVEIQAQPQVAIAGCEQAERLARESLSAADGGLQTYLVMPI